jgi:hypothetical protein
MQHSSQATNCQAAAEDQAMMLQEAQARQLRTALAAAAAAAGNASMTHAHSASLQWSLHESWQGSLQESAQWHPGDDDGYDVSDAQLDVLLQKLGVAGQLNPSAQTGACIRLLQAFRAGELGQYMLDDVE